MSEGEVEMGKLDSVSEILELAVEREEDAYRFYTDLAKHATNPMLQRMFKSLAKVELEHKEKFELELIKEGNVLVDKKRVEDFDLNKYASGTQFIDDMGYGEVLVMGIEKEKRSVRFYFELAAIAMDKESREALLALAEEEASHKAQLQIEYDNWLSRGQ
jgi:rubrerythrin